MYKAYRGFPGFGTFMIVSLFAVLFSVQGLMAVHATNADYSSTVVINEILASNGAGLMDEDGDTGPWLELYNSGDEPVNLEYFGLTDDTEELWKWIFPEILLDPGQFLIVFASGKDRRNPDEPLHLNFRISSEGEELQLTDLNGRQIDRLFPVKLDTDVSYGRYPDGSHEWYYFDEPTPGGPNSKAGYLYRLDPPVFSVSGGFYTEDLLLDLAVVQDQARIHYTVDGSVPDQDSPMFDGSLLIGGRSEDENILSRIPTSPAEGVRNVGFEWKEPSVKVFKGSVIRARAFAPDAMPSRVETHTYFVHPEGPDRYTLPVVSLVTDSLHLFCYETGIYVPGKIYDEQEGTDHLVGNYAERGLDWERPAAFEFFDLQGRRVFAQDIGVRIHGGASRSLPQKSLRIYARNKYGEHLLGYPFFPDQTDRAYNRLILRNSGQDFFVRSTMFRDAFMQRLVRDFNFDTQAYQPAIVFINGEYWGIHNIRERYDVHYLERTWGVDPDRVDLLNDEFEVRAGDDEHYRKMIDYIREHDLSEQSHFEKVSTLMDVDHFVDYLIAQVFLRNIDWPGNNLDYWRYRSDYNPDAPPGHDGRWRWMLVDTDAGFGLLNPWRVESYDMIRHMTREGFDDWPNPDWSTFLIRNLLKNESFQEEFLRRFSDYLNSVFRPDHVIKLIDEFENRLEPEIGEHILRWGQIRDKERWHFNVERLRDFARKRPRYVYLHLLNHFQPDAVVEVAADVSSLQQGTIQINRLTLDERMAGIPANRQSVYPWHGLYFEGIPLTVVARAYEGYRLSHWEITGDTAGIISKDAGDSTGEIPPRSALSGRKISPAHPGADTVVQKKGTHRIEGDTIYVTPRSDLKIKAVFTEDVLNGGYFPAAHILQHGDYHMKRWDSNSEPGTWPENMVFQYMRDDDPGLNSPAVGYTTGAFNLTSRTRINGLGEQGFSFINTDNPDGNPGYPGRRLGAALLALDTRGMKDIRVSWTGGTIEPHSRVYHIRLQYRTDIRDEFEDVLDDFGHPVEYRRHVVPGHYHRFHQIALPPSADNKPRVELRWKYYFSGKRLSEESGERSRLRVSQIRVTGESLDFHLGELIEEHRILANYPNPFNDQTYLQILLPEESRVSVLLFDATGRLVKEVLRDNRLSAGHQLIRVKAGDLPSGVYLYRVQTSEWAGIGKITLVR